MDNITVNLEEAEKAWKKHYDNLSDEAKKFYDKMTQDGHISIQEREQALNDWYQQDQQKQKEVENSWLILSGIGESISAFSSSLDDLEEIRQMFTDPIAGEANTIVDEFYDIAVAAEKANYVAKQSALSMDSLMAGTQELFGQFKDPIAEALINNSTEGLGDALKASLEEFAAQKAAHLLMESAYETVLGVAALLNPFRSGESAGHFAAAAQYASGAAAMAGFVYAFDFNAPSGKAHDGIDYIPQEGTWLLDKGERVVDARTNKDLKDFISQSSNSINVNVAINGGDKKSIMEALPELEKVIVQAVSGNIIMGGQIKRTIMDYTR